jgi:type II secretory pathway pseudopilin PulG
MSSSIGLGHEEEREAVKLPVFTDEKGDSLVEVLVAVAIIAIVFTVFLAALSTGSLSVKVVHERVTAENIARSQLEHVKETGFITGTDHYTPTAISHPGYSATIAATTIYTGVQLITITVYHNGPVFTIGNYKVDR